MFSEMARRSKVKKGAPGSAGKAAARKTKPSSAADKAEPFYRPFTKLKAEKAQGKGAARKAAGAGAGAAAATAAQKTASKADGASKKKPIQPESALSGDAAPEPVDPDTFAIYMAGVRAL